MVKELIELARKELEWSVKLQEVSAHILTKQSDRASPKSVILTTTDVYIQSPAYKRSQKPRGVKRRPLQAAPGP
jgi:hypothetical protein